MRAGWSTILLGDVCDILDSKRKPITKRDRLPGPFPYYGATGVLDYVASYIFDEKLVLIGEDGAKWGAGENTAYVADGKYWVNNHAHVIRPNRNRLLDNWLVYNLNWADLSLFITGLTVPELNQAKLREIPIPLPPLAEQRRIVAILDEAFAGLEVLRANAEKNRANARALFESYLNAVFSHRGKGWAERTIDDIAHIKGGKRVPKGYKLTPEPTNHPYISVSDFNENGGIDLDTIRYISDNVYDEIKRYTISPDNLYISIAGTIGKTGIIPKQLDAANLTENACKLVFKGSVYNKFIYYFTRTSSFADQALLNTRVAAQPKLALERLKTIKLSLPEKPDQVRIANDLDALLEETQKLEAIYQRKLDTFAELKQSILNKAFAGELTSAPEKALAEAGA